MNPEECNFQEIQLVSKESSPSKVPARVYCSWCQVELTSTWNPHTLCIHGYLNTETYPRLDSGRQFGGHKLTNLPKTPMVLFYILDSSLACLPSICSCNFDIYHPSLGDLVARLSSFIQHENIFPKIQMNNP